MAIDKSKIEYKIVVHPEDIPIEGNASAIDPETDAQIVADIRAQLERGNEWAWCCVEVVAYIPGLEITGNDYLGACSCRDEADFKAGGYYEDMCQRAAAELEERASAMLQDLKNAGVA